MCPLAALFGGDSNRLLTMGCAPASDIHRLGSCAWKPTHGNKAANTSTKKLLQTQSGDYEV